MTSPLQEEVTVIYQPLHTAKVRLESEVVSFIFVYMRMRKRMREMKTKMRRMLQEF